MAEKRQWDIFINSVFFVLGFSVIFSLLGVLLQSVLSNVAYSVQKWLSYIGGIIIILFGLYLLGLIRIKFLEREYKIHVKRKFKYSYVTSFVFGAVFAIGWTPCVGAVLGAILALAASNPGSAFKLLLAYSIGLGLPFLLVGLFTTQASNAIKRFGSKLRYVNYFFGVLLILLGILVFTSQLSRIANLPFLSDLLIKLNASGPSFAGSFGIKVSFIAGLVSFLSPCVLPLIPAFFSYLATTVTANVKGKKDE